MNNVLAIVDLYENCDLGLLTRERPLASTTLLGRYAFIDFALSNLSNSGIDNICVLAKIILIQFINILEIPILT